MKTIIKSLLYLIVLMIATPALLKAQMKTDSIFAKGSCEHCKERIETTVKLLNGVERAEWQGDYNRLVVKYDQTKLKNIDIHSALAGVGHDTKEMRADDKIYKSLPGCCRYERDPILKKGSPINTIEFVIEGMTCDVGCAIGIETKLFQQKGVKFSEVNYNTKRAKVIFDQSKITKDELVRLIETFEPENGEKNTYKVVLLY